MIELQEKDQILLPVKIFISKDADNEFFSTLGDIVERKSFLSKDVGPLNGNYRMAMNVGDGKGDFSIAILPLCASALIRINALPLCQTCFSPLCRRH